MHLYCPSMLALPLRRRRVLSPELRRLTCRLRLIHGRAIDQVAPLRVAKVEGAVVLSRVMVSLARSMRFRSLLLLRSLRLTVGVHFRIRQLGIRLVLIVSLLGWRALQFAHLLRKDA